MKTIKVSLKNRSYDIIIGCRLLNKIGEFIQKIPLDNSSINHSAASSTTEKNIGKDAYIITHDLIKNRYGRILTDSLKLHGFNFKFKTIPASEKSKSLNTAYSIIKDLTNYDKKKNVFIIAFGGGVIGDLSGFIASIYKRGIPYIQIPTTLLAQVDSSIGGKTAVDLESGKNLVGSFYQPKLVLSDIMILKSLNLRQLRSGLAEVIKYGVIKDPVLFKFMEEEYKDILKKEEDALEFIVCRSSSIKANIVGQDEIEKKGIRTILNFGHTMGHAIETAGNYKNYNHGEAISLGMLISADISQMLNLTEINVFQRIERIIKIFGLPNKIKEISFDSIIKAHYHDKKFSGAKNKFITIEKIGKTKIIENVPLEIIKEALKKRFSAISP